MGLYKLTNYLRVLKNETLPHVCEIFIKYCINLKSLPDSKVGILVQHAPKKISLPLLKKKYRLTKNLPKISLVTPSFNQGGFIGETIDSVLSQNYQNFSLHVQDGGSDDKTIEILQSIADTRFSFNSGIDRGQANAINIGFKDSDGEIMAWLNSDDLLLPDAFIVVANFFKKNPNIDVVFGHRLVIDESGYQIGRWVMPPYEEEILSWVDYIPQETLFWRRGAWDLVGGEVDEKFQFALDWDLILRFRAAGAKFARIPSFLGAFRVHGEQKTSTQISTVGTSEMERILIRIHGRLPSQEEIDEHISRYRSKHRYEDLKWTIKNFLIKR